MKINIFIIIMLEFIYTHNDFDVYNSFYRIFENINHELLKMDDHWKLAIDYYKNECNLFKDCLLTLNLKHLKTDLFLETHNFLKNILININQNSQNYNNLEIQIFENLYLNIGNNNFSYFCLHFSSNFKFQKQNQFSLGILSCEKEILSVINENIKKIFKNNDLVIKNDILNYTEEYEKKISIITNYMEDINKNLSLSFSLIRDLQDNNLDIYFLQIFQFFIENPEINFSKKLELLKCFGLLKTIENLNNCIKKRKSLTYALLDLYVEYFIFLFNDSFSLFEKFVDHFEELRNKKVNFENIIDNAIKLYLNNQEALNINISKSLEFLSIKDLVNQAKEKDLQIILNFKALYDLLKWSMNNKYKAFFSYYSLLENINKEKIDFSNPQIFNNLTFQRNVDANIDINKDIYKENDNNHKIVNVKNIITSSDSEISLSSSIVNVKDETKLNSRYEKVKEQNSYNMMIKNHPLFKNKSFKIKKHEKNPIIKNYILKKEAENILNKNKNNLNNVETQNKKNNKYYHINFVNLNNSQHFSTKNSNLLKEDNDFLKKFNITVIHYSIFLKNIETYNHINNIVVYIHSLIIFNLNNNSLNYNHVMKNFFKETHCLLLNHFRYIVDEASKTYCGLCKLENTSFIIENDLNLRKMILKEIFDYLGKIKEYKNQLKLKLQAFNCKIQKFFKRTKLYVTNINMGRIYKMKNNLKTHEKMKNLYDEGLLLYNNIIYTTVFDRDILINDLILLQYWIYCLKNII